MSILQATVLFLQIKSNEYDQQICFGTVQKNDPVLEAQQVVYSVRWLCRLNIILFQPKTDLMLEPILGAGCGQFANPNQKRL